MQDTIFIIDFGSPYSQLIGRKLRQMSVYCEVHPYTQIPAVDYQVKGIILSGNPEPSDLKRFKDRIPLLKVAPEDGVPDTTRLAHFAKNVCGCSGDWTPQRYIASAIDDLRTKIGEEHVVMAMSGGVDSTVTAVLLHKAIGQQLHGIFVDNGLLREDEFPTVLSTYRKMGRMYVELTPRPAF